MVIHVLWMTQTSIEIDANNPASHEGEIWYFYYIIAMTYMMVLNKMRRTGKHYNTVKIVSYSRDDPLISITIVEFNHVVCDTYQKLACDYDATLSTAPISSPNVNFCYYLFNISDQFASKTINYLLNAHSRVETYYTDHCFIKSDTNECSKILD